MWANAQRDGRPVEYRWRPLFNPAKLEGKVGNGPTNKLLNFGGDPDTNPDTDPDPDRDIGKTCPGRGMHCSSASSYYYSPTMHKEYVKFSESLLRLLRNNTC